MQQQSTYPSIDMSASQEGKAWRGEREKDAEVEDEEEADIKDRIKVRVYCPISPASAFYGIFSRAAFTC